MLECAAHKQILPDAKQDSSTARLPPAAMLKLEDHARKHHQADQPGVKEAVDLAAKPPVQVKKDDFHKSDAKKAVDLAAEPLVATFKLEDDVCKQNQLDAQETVDLAAEPLAAVCTMDEALHEKVQRDV